MFLPASVVIPADQVVADHVDAFLGGHEDFLVQTVVLGVAALLAADFSYHQDCHAVVDLPVAVAFAVAEAELVEGHGQLVQALLQ